MLVLIACGETKRSVPSAPSGSGAFGGTLATAGRDRRRNQQPDEFSSSTGGAAGQAAAQAQTPPVKRCSEP